MKRFWPCTPWLLTLLLTLVPTRPAAAAEGVVALPVPAENATAYDENRNGQADLEGDTWVYDQNGDGRAELVIAFRPQGNGVAYVYDDGDGDGQVRYAVTEAGVQVLELYWRIKVTRRHPAWYLPNGAPDWNLDLAVDSGFKMTGGEPEFDLLDYGAGDSQGDSAFDGLPELTIRYWDTNQDGIPEFEYNNAQPGTPYDAWMVNKNARLKVQPLRRFPLLETILQVDWQRARVTRIRHLIPSRSNEAGYFLYFNGPTAPDAVNLSWENPFAFYDLHGDQDGVAELKLRTVTEDHDRRADHLARYNEIRYSWAQRGDNPDYRLYLIGQALNSQVFQYPLYAVGHIPYEELPAFVLAETWQGAALAEYESLLPVAFTEGIYENLAFTPILRGKLLDHRAVELPRYLPAYLGLREEYNFDAYARQPRLYFSPLDRRLHLVGAQQGLIILAAHSTGARPMNFSFSDQELRSGELDIAASVTYADSDRDGYADTWRYLEQEQPVAEFIFRPGAALLAGGDTLAVKLLPSGVSASSWKAPPPATPGEWQTFQERLDAGAATRRTLDDLAGMFADLPGDAVTLAPVRLLQVSGRSDHLMAHVATDGLTAPLPPEVLTILPQPLPAGEYALWEQDGQLWLAPPTPPQVELSAITFAPTPGSPPDEQGGAITFSARNAGTLDVEAGEIVVQERSNAGVTTLLAQTTVLPAQSQVDFRLPWTPATAGPRTIHVQLRYAPSSGAGTTTRQAQLDLETHVPVTSSAVLYLSHGRSAMLAALATLLVLLIAAGTFLFTRAAGG